MRKLIASFALFTAMLTTAATAQAMVLYETSPWVVSREDVSGTQTCAAKVESPDKWFLLVGGESGAAIIIWMANWHFTQHKGSLMLKVDDAGMGSGNGADYDGNFVRLAAATDAIYLIMRGIVVPGSNELEVLGEDNKVTKVIATFDVAGLDGALKAWKACVDGPEILNMLADGVSLFNQNNLQGAVGKFDAVIKADPTVTAAYIYRGMAEFRLGKPEIARKDIETALKIEPDNLSGHYDLGSLKYMAGDYRGAIADFNAVLAQKPNHSYVVRLRGSAYAQLGEYAAAVKDLSLAMRLNPSYTDLRPELASNMFRARQFDAAAAEYHTLASDPKAAGAAYNMLFEFIAVAHAGKDGSAALAEDQAKLPSHEWPYPIFEFFLGRMDERDLLKSASTERQTCEAKYYVGEKTLLDGNKPLAGAWFRDVAKSCPDNLEEQWRARWYGLSGAAQ